MINLIPKSERLRQIKFYQKRFLVVMFLSSAVAWVVGLFFLVPVYLSAKAKTVSLEENISFSKSLSATKGEGNPEFIVKEITGKINTLLPKETMDKPTKFFSAIINAKPNGVKINGFTYTDKGGGVAEIEVRGIASNRDTLTEFSQVLEKEILFSKVVVPVSSFVKERDLDFAIQILTKKSKK